MRQQYANVEVWVAEVLPPGHRMHSTDAAPGTQVAKIQIARSFRIVQLWNHALPRCWLEATACTAQMLPQAKQVNRTRQEFK